MTTEERRLERWKALGIRVWSIVGVLVLVAVAMMVIGRIMPAIIPFLMAAVLIFLFRAPVARLEAAGAPRWAATLLCFIIGIALLALAGLFVFPILANQLTQFVAAFPTYYDQASKTGLDLVGRYWSVAPGWAREMLTNLQAAAAVQVEVAAKAAAEGLVAAGGSIVTFVIDGVLAFFIAFYVLIDLPIMRRELLLIAGSRWRGDAEVIFDEITKVVGGFLRGQAIIAIVNGVLTALGLWLLGIPYSGVIGFITGLLSIIPFIGPVIGGVIVAITGLFVSPLKALLGVILMVGIQQLEGNLLSPRIMSAEVDLHPALVIFSLLAGAEVAGLLGMLVAIPVAATGKALFVYYFEKRTGADLSTEGGALFAQGKADAPAKKRRAGRNDAEK